jgi:hypothetical protein
VGAVLVHRAVAGLLRGGEGWGRRGLGPGLVVEVSGAGIVQQVARWRDV